METSSVGKVIVSAKIENVVDLYAASQGQIPDDQVRRIEVTDALVDTGTTHLGMPRRLIEQLGIPQVATLRVGYDFGVPELRDLRSRSTHDPGSCLFGRRVRECRRVPRPDRPYAAGGA